MKSLTCHGFAALENALSMLDGALTRNPRDFVEGYWHVKEVIEDGYAVIKRSEKAGK